MTADGIRVAEAFRAWLEAQEWTVTVEAEGIAVLAKTRDRMLHAEATGRTAATGPDIDALYGRILRRMPLKEDGARFVIVVPEEAEAAALGVPPRVRHALGIEVFVVESDGTVRAATGGMGSDLSPLDRNSPRRASRSPRSPSTRRTSRGSSSTSLAAGQRAMSRR